MFGCEPTAFSSSHSFGNADREREDVVNKSDCLFVCL